MSMPSVFVKVTVGAAEMPLEVVSTFKGSDLTIGVIDVPKNRFGLEITGVNVRVENALEAAINVAAVRKGNVYVATFPASHFELSGSVTDGVTVTLTGKDEKGIERSWIAGKGTLLVLEADGAVRPGEDYKTLHWYSVAPVNPQPGDVAPVLGFAKVWSGSAWVDFAGGGSSSGGSGAVVLRVDGGKVYKGDKEVALFSDLLAMVQGGGVTLLNTVGGNPKDALYYPHYCDENGVRFDATGILGSAAQTRSIVMQPTASGNIRITPGSLVELAKKNDLLDYVGKQSSGMVEVAKTFSDVAVDNQAIVRGFKIPERYLEKLVRLGGFKIRGASSDSGIWDRDSMLAIASGHEEVYTAGATMPIGASATFEILGGGIEFSASGDLAVRFVKSDLSQASVRIGLVSVNASEGFSITLSNGVVRTDLAPILTVLGSVDRSRFVDSIVGKDAKISAVKSLASNASQSQIIAKLNELIGLYK